MTGTVLEGRRPIVWLSQVTLQLLLMALCRIQQRMGPGDGLTVLGSGVGY